MKEKLHRLPAFIALIIMLLCGIFLQTSCSGGEDADKSETPLINTGDPAGTNDPADTTPDIPPHLADTPFGRYGTLQVLNGQLCDQNANPVQLKGMSSFGLQWGEGYWLLTDEAFDVLANDWQCDIIRLAMYVNEGGYGSNPSRILERVELGIELAAARGLYVLVDWHVLTPGDPTDESYLTAGLDDPDMPAEFIKLRDENPDFTGPQVFFAYIAQKYGSLGNVLYEPANEPNRLGTHNDRFSVWSERLKPYFESVINVIREYDAAGIIICGTDNWSQYVDGPVNDPIADANTMYTMHFYAGTHDTGYTQNADGTVGSYWLREMVDSALSNGLAVFCTEWGTSTASGDGGPYIDFALRWTEYMQDKGISWCAWSAATKYEVSAAFTNEASSYPDGAWGDSEMTISGRFYRAGIKGADVPMYTADLQVAHTPDDALHNGDVQYLPQDMPSDFVSLPFTFESQTREGWAKDGGSRIENAHLSVGIAQTESLMFPFTFTTGGFNEWEDGARLGSPHWPRNALPVEECEKITAYEMEIFLEDEKATVGDLQLAVVLVPDGGSYWHEVDAGRVTIDPINGGELITGANGAALRKYTLNIPFTTKEYSGSVSLRVRNIILALYNNEDNECDYSGYIYYDNIGFVFD